MCQIVSCIVGVQGLEEKVSMGNPTNVVAVASLVLVCAIIPLVECEPSGNSN